MTVGELVWVSNCQNSISHVSVTLVTLRQHRMIPAWVKKKLKCKTIFLDLMVYTHLLIVQQENLYKWLSVWSSCHHDLMFLYIYIHITYELHMLIWYCSLFKENMTLICYLMTSTKQCQTLTMSNKLKVYYYFIVKSEYHIEKQLMIGSLLYTITCSWINNKDFHTCHIVFKF